MSEKDLRTELETLSLKIRISVLWLFSVVIMTLHFAVSIFEPNVVNLIISGKMQIGEEIFLLSALLAIVSLTMAFLSVTLKDSTNRWANIIVGVVITVFYILHLTIEQITAPSIHMAQPSIHQLLMNLSTVVVTAMIVWYAWKWPKGTRLLP